MLGWPLTFLAIALLAALFGFGGLATATAAVAKFLFVVFLAMFAIALLARALRSSPPV